MTNIEYGSIDFEKVIIESMLSKFENWKRTRNGPPMGWGGGWLLMMIGDAMTPLTPCLTPRLTPSLMLFNFEFDVTVFDVPVFDVTHLYLTFQKIIEAFGTYIAYGLSRQSSITMVKEFLIMCSVLTLYLYN